jgi:hypothetical protein
MQARGPLEDGEEDDLDKELGQLLDQQGDTSHGDEPG